MILSMQSAKVIVSRIPDVNVYKGNNAFKNSTVDFIG